MTDKEIMQIIMEASVVVPKTDGDTGYYKLNETDAECVYEALDRFGVLRDDKEMIKQDNLAQDLVKGMFEQPQQPLEQSKSEMKRVSSQKGEDEKWIDIIMTSGGRTAKYSFNRAESFERAAEIIRVLLQEDMIRKTSM